jgi:hypothetical protein
MKSEDGRDEKGMRLNRKACAVGLVALYAILILSIRSHTMPTGDFTDDFDDPSMPLWNREGTTVVENSTVWLDDGILYSKAAFLRGTLIMNVSSQTTGGALWGFIDVSTPDGEHPRGLYYLYDGSSDTLYSVANNGSSPVVRLIESPFQRGIYRQYQILWMADKTTWRDYATFRIGDVSITVSTGIPDESLRIAFTEGGGGNLSAGWVSYSGSGAFTETTITTSTRTITATSTSTRTSTVDTTTTNVRTVTATSTGDTVTVTATLPVTYYTTAMTLQTTLTYTVREWSTLWSTTVLAATTRGTVYTTSMYTVWVNTNTSTVYQPVTLYTGTTSVEYTATITQFVTNQTVVYAQVTKTPTVTTTATYTQGVSLSAAASGVALAVILTALVMRFGYENLRMLFSRIAEGIRKRRRAGREVEVYEEPEEGVETGEDGSEGAEEA